MTYNKIPTDEEFARAKSFMREKNRGLSEAGEFVLSGFKSRGLNQIFMFYDQDTKNFYANVFYDCDAQIAEAEQSGLSDEVKQAVYTALEKVGRGTKDTLTVNFEFDSNENVERNYGGNYFNRLMEMLF